MVPAHCFLPMSSTLTKETGSSEAFWPCSSLLQASSSFVPAQYLPPAEAFMSANSSHGWMEALPFPSNDGSISKGDEY